METDNDMTTECTSIPLPTSRSSTPDDLFTPCEQLIQVQNEIKKFTLLTIGAQQSLNSLAPFMTADDPEVTELFQRLVLPGGIKESRIDVSNVSNQTEREQTEPDWREEAGSRKMWSVKKEPGRKKRRQSVFNPTESL
ncbi:hypothetical protein TNIN_186401 [Trichonephila inaurata madagascariensis]|uniref:Uncharacterized protein n=1 Tax=Trichonephila inaurata madagascariensis TaxID=2747483 RepID=A0A8X6XV35_9ARAC|nr:hypothetical protein TNIN_186401 [Trichonephila inaurata madagascariensis]